MFICDEETPKRSQVHFTLKIHRHPSCWLESSHTEVTQMTEEQQRTAGPLAKHSFNSVIQVPTLITGSTMKPRSEMILPGDLEPPVASPSICILQQLHLKPSRQLFHTTSKWHVGAQHLIPPPWRTEGRR